MTIEGAIHRAPPVLRLHEADNVAVARIELTPDLDLTKYALPNPNQRVRRGHKIALSAMSEGTPIRKFGQIIGYATDTIAPGDMVHSHNLGMGDVVLDHMVGTDIQHRPAAPDRFFNGYMRADGRAGTRNCIAILSSVNCSATVTHRIAAHFAQPGALDSWPGVDGVIALTHGGGCALDMRSEGYKLLTRTIAGYAAHPNVGGVLMVGLGCETNQIPMLLGRHGLATSDRLRSFTIQDTGGTAASVRAGIEAVQALAEQIGGVARQPVHLSKLTLALQCGGSDSYSGITANPALGIAADMLVAHGGTAVLAETPEIYGAEHLLTRRAVTSEVAQKLMERIEWWHSYTARHGAEMDNNPSFGNKQGGLTTILEKSLGAVAKAGTSPLTAVYEYGERIEDTGFVFMDSPGYDPVSVTGQVAAGCNLVAFTTGRGSVSGFRPAPTLKLATNELMYARMEDDMDINCGPIAAGDLSIQEAGEMIFEQLIAIASGERTKSEILDYGDNEFVPWPMGAVL